MHLQLYQTYLINHTLSESDVFYHKLNRKPWLGLKMTMKLLRLKKVTWKAANIKHFMKKNEACAIAGQTKEMLYK